jgi:hypothetical protein
MPYTKIGVPSGPLQEQQPAATISADPERVSVNNTINNRIVRSRHRHRSKGPTSASGLDLRLCPHEHDCKWLKMHINPGRR